jgi:hypothetical protein
VGEGRGEGAASPSGRGQGGGSGFDAVIGNPPYVRIQALREFHAGQVEYLKRRYHAGSKGNFDIYVLFVERGLELLNGQGRLGFIIPNKFFNAQYGQPLRELLSKGRHVSHIVHFGDQQVFHGATTYTCMLFLDKSGARECQFVGVRDLVAWCAGDGASAGSIPAEGIGAAEWNFAVGPAARLLQKLRDMAVQLGNVADIFVGVQTSADDVFIMDLIRETTHELCVRSRALGREVTLEKGLLFPLISGTDVDRYCALPHRQYILFLYRVEREKAVLLGFNLIEEEFPRIAAYLMENRARLEARERGRFRGETWYRFGRSQNLGIQQRVKVCVPRLVRSLCAAFDAEGTFFLDNVDVGGVTLKADSSDYDPRYLVGLLNSTALRWYFPHVSATFRGGWRSANRQFLSQLPIRTIDFSDPADKARHDKMVELVQRMLDLHKRLAAANTEHEKTALQRQIAATDRQIGQLVYELYGLTDAEIRIVEEGTR